MANRLDLVALIDRHLPSTRRAFSMGTTLLLAALNRAVWPCSKRSGASWAEHTSLAHLFALQPAALTSQFVWDPMDVISGPALEAIAAEWTRKVIHDLTLSLDTLFYDTTNCLTYLARARPRPPRPLQAKADGPPAMQSGLARGPRRPASPLCLGL
jgi:hypothetical protein